MLNLHEIIKLQRKKKVIELKNVTIDLGNIEIVEMVIKDWRHCEKLLEITLGAV